ncbi:MAG: isoaspartyl peptidase/L-asparaginase [Myxococcota bacterium]
MTPTVVVHGGAGRVDPARQDAHVAGCERAAAEGFAVLRGGGSALDAAQRAVEVLEADALYNAGIGGSLTAQGTLEFDAALMEGAALRVAGVCALPPFPHPIRVARSLYEADHYVLLAGEGAAAFARAHGHEDASPDAMITERARARLEAWREGRVGEGWAGGTVGAVAVDAAGSLAAATSTGGTVGKPPGRIGDSPVPGAGTWADNESAACSATGIGEAILRIGLARSVCDAIRRGDDAQTAAEASVAELASRGRGEGGLIVVSPHGDVGVARNTATMSYAVATADGVRSGF